MSIFKKISLNKVEVAVIVLVFSLLIIGIVIASINTKAFEEGYVVEDGFIEWLTVLPLFITFCIAASYLLKLFKTRSLLFSLTVLLLALFCFFAAGEEISWGQRIFNTRSSEYFVKHNSQQETNVHNLVLNGKRINKLIFSQLLIVAAALYLVGLPLLYRKNKRFKKFIDYAGIPVAKTYQVIGCLSVFALSAVTPSDKNAELLEFGGCFMFLLIVLYPANQYVFRRNSARSIL